MKYQIELDKVIREEKDAISYFRRTQKDKERASALRDYSTEKLITVVLTLEDEMKKLQKTVGTQTKKLEYLEKTYLR